MAVLLILSTLLIAVMVAHWAWRFHLQALQILGPGLVRLAGISAPASTAEVVSVLVEDDTILVGLRPARAGSARPPGTTRRAPESTLVLSLDGQRCGPVARLQRWQASGAPVVLWQDDTGHAELCQLKTDQHVRLPMLAGTTDSRPAHATGHPSQR